MQFSGGTRLFNKGLLAVIGASLMTVGMPGGVASAAAPTSLLRLAHLSPDAPSVDVYVDGERRLAGAAFKHVSGYLRVPAGSHRVEMRKAGTGTSGAALVSSSVQLPAGGARTVAAIGRAASLRERVYNDSLSSPASGTGKLRVMHAAQGVPPADVKAGGKTIFNDIAFAADPGYRSVPGGSYDVTMTPANTNQVLLAAQGVAVQAGSIYSIWAVGGAGKALSLVRALDASGASLVPSGGAGMGAGGLAGLEARWALYLAAGGAVLMLSGSTALVRRRRAS